MSSPNTTATPDIPCYCVLSEVKKGFYLIDYLIGFFAIWGVATAIHKFSYFYIPVYTATPIQFKRTTVSHGVLALLTTVLGIWNAILLNLTYTQNEHGPDWDYAEEAIFIELLIICLLLFILMYRVRTRWFIAVHHLAISAYFIASVYRFENPNFSDYGKLFIIQCSQLIAMTTLWEQPVLILLLYYRFEKRYPRLLVAAAVQNAIIKLLFHIWSIVVWISESNDVFWWWFYPLVVFGAIIPTQAFSIYTQFSLARRMFRNIPSSTSSEKKREEQDENSEDENAPNSPNGSLEMTFSSSGPLSQMPTAECHHTSSPPSNGSVDEDTTDPESSRKKERRNTKSNEEITSSRELLQVSSAGNNFPLEEPVEHV